jgi:ribonuclease VapC
MIIDTSALIAIFLAEPTSAALLDAMERASKRIISSVSLLEAGIVVRARSGAAALPLLYDLMDEINAEIAVFEEAHAKAAVAAFARFGKGMKHRAQLNYGDCAVYALAALRGEPVLAVGKDFATTDLTLVRY